VDRLHGVEVRDPYRWLEDPSKPEVEAWMKAQDDYARSRLAKLPGRDALAARLRELFYRDEISPPAHRGTRFFYSRRHKDKEKLITYWKQGENGAVRGRMVLQESMGRARSSMRNSWRPTFSRSSTTAPTASPLRGTPGKGETAHQGRHGHIELARSLHIRSPNGLGGPLRHGAASPARGGS
jgi:hypothetical protein